MPEMFDAYHTWLGIPPERQPPNCYDLLGIPIFEDKPEVIEAAADRQMGHLRTYQVGKRGDLSQKLLNEVATARVVLDNGDGAWVPGTFVSGVISVSEENLPVVVPRDAVQNIEGRNVVFVEHEGAFEMTPVTTGRSDRERAEIVAGLEAGTRYAAEGAFQLKATVITSALDSHAGHGH